MESLRYVRISTNLIVLSISFTFAVHAQDIAVAIGSIDLTRVTPAENIGTRLALLLNSDAQDVRRRALDQVVFYSHFSDGRIDFTTTVPVLLAIYSEDPEEPHRLAALSALSAIGNEPAMRLLREYIQDQPSRRVQVATLGALIGYYGISVFEGDREIAALAENLMKRSTRPVRMKAEPHVVVK